MRKGLFFRMAATNLKKNRQTYLPFIMTCVGSSAMYYILGALAVSENVENLYGGEGLQLMLGFGKWIVGIFSVIFLFYTNSFLLKRRKKEFGLYNIMGLEKRHIAGILFLEFLDTAFISLALGIVVGLLLYKGVFLFLLRILNFEAALGFEVAWGIVRETLIFFGVIFLILYVNGFRQIQIAEPIELLKSGQVGEREPKTRWVLTLIGFASLGLGYYLAVVTESPIEAIVMFFVAVIFVIIGTYCLFTAGSIFILKALRKNKRYYYKVNHFTSISGMIYRMKQNAAGLASISIMSTAVLLIMSTVNCLYFGMNEIVGTRYPRDLMVTIPSIQKEDISEVCDSMEKTVESFGAAMQQEESYRYRRRYLKQNGNRFSWEELSSSWETIEIYMLPLEDYNRATGENKTLGPDEMLLQTVHGLSGTDMGGTIIIGDQTWKVREDVDGLDSPSSDLVLIENIYYAIFPTMEDIDEMVREIPGEEIGTCSYFCGFDLNVDEKTKDEIWDTLEIMLEGKNYEGFYVESITEARENFYMLYGGMFFIGIFLGLMFFMATVLIIYYKQITEGYEDHDRFVIMQKVGMEKREVKRSISSQIRTVFLLPVLMAGVHIVFAYPMMSRLLVLLNLTNQKLFMISVLITFLVFLLFYGVVYALTSRTYYRLVRW